MAISLVEGVEVEYTPNGDDMFVGSTICGQKIEWQTDPSESLWVPLKFNELIKVSDGSTIYFRTSDKKATVTQAPATL